MWALFHLALCEDKLFCSSFRRSCAHSLRPFRASPAFLSHQRLLQQKRCPLILVQIDLKWMTLSASKEGGVGWGGVDEQDVRTLLERGSLCEAVPFSSWSFVLHSPLYAFGYLSRLPPFTPTVSSGFLLSWWPWQKQRKILRLQSTSCWNVCLMLYFNSNHLEELPAWL